MYSIIYEKILLEVEGSLKHACWFGKYVTSRTDIDLFNKGMIK